MLKLSSAKNVLPSSIYITDVTTEYDFRSIVIGGLGHTFRGKHSGQEIALKLFVRDPRKVGPLPFVFLIILIHFVRNLEKSKDF